VEIANFINLIDNKIAKIEIEMSNNVKWNCIWRKDILSRYEAD
jgi:hypothetical protein